MVNIRPRGNSNRRRRRRGGGDDDDGRLLLRRAHSSSSSFSSSSSSYSSTATTTKIKRSSGDSVRRIGGGGGGRLQTLRSIIFVNTVIVSIIVVACCLLQLQQTEEKAIHRNALLLREGSRKQERLLDKETKFSSNNNEGATNVAAAAAAEKKEEEGISACLFIKDDNIRLVEWLAYHYHTLPLRHVIVAVDPDSQTSPLPILERYNSNNNNIKYNDEEEDTVPNGGRHHRRPLLEYILWDETDYLSGPQILKRRRKRSKLLQALKGSSSNRHHHHHHQHHNGTNNNNNNSTDNTAGTSTNDDGGDDDDDDDDYSVSNADAALLFEMQEMHREGQKMFLSQCYRHHKLLNHSWVLHVDTDEYVAFNVPSSDDPSPAVVMVNDNDSGSSNIDDDEITTGNNGTALSSSSTAVKTDASGTINPERKTLPNRMGGPTTTLDVINRFDRGPCIGMVRLLFSAVEEEEESDINNDYDETQREALPLNNNNYGSINPKQLDTLRYFRHHVKGAADPKADMAKQIEKDGTDTTIGPRSFNGRGKVLLDVSRLSWDRLSPERIFSIHRPITPECPRNYFGPKAYGDSLFRVNHYLGSWESYAMRSDIRRSRQSYNEKAGFADGPSFEMRPWLSRFVEQVGVQKAQFLLERNMVSVQPKEAETQRRCAILFFAGGEIENGPPFIRNSSKVMEIEYPFIKKNILNANPTCDVFVHAYKQHTTTQQAMTNATDSGDLETLLLLLTNGDSSKIVLESDDDFHQQRDLSHYRDLFPKPTGWRRKERAAERRHKERRKKFEKGKEVGVSPDAPGEYPQSVNGTIRQWHSIRQVWKRMESHEETALHKRYDRVGLFRPDVHYPHSIRIMEHDEHNDNDDAVADVAVIPSTMYNHSIGCNDLMFYGQRIYAEVWATERFDSLTPYLQWREQQQQQQQKQPQKQQPFVASTTELFSEDFMRFLLTKLWSIPLTTSTSISLIPPL